MSPISNTGHHSIRSTLQHGKDLGFLGPGPIEGHIQHSLSFLPWIVDHSTIMDLGSGGGVPGLVLAHEMTRTGQSPEKTVTLVDANRRRCEFLEEAVGELGLSGHTRVVHGRAEQLARLPTMRHQFDCVVARSFGPPAVVAECAVGFLATGGRLVVSEPPEERAERWNVEGLRTLGLELSERSTHSGFSLQVLSVSTPCSDRFPRRNGIPAKRPLF